MYLALLRHAKADPAFGTLTDHERPLAPAGIAHCQRLAGWLSAQGIRFERALVSSARRTQQTADLVLSNPPPTRENLANLYEADLTSLTNLLINQTLQGSLLVVGHNPTMHQAVLAWARPLTPTYDEMPPGTLALFAVGSPTFSPSHLQLTQYILPQQLLSPTP